MKILSYRYLPLNFFIGYTFFVLASLLVGPIKYVGIDYVVLMSFILPFNFLFCIGYLLGAQGDYWQNSRVLDLRFVSLNRVRRFFNTILFIAVVNSLTKWYSLLISGIDLSLSSLGTKYTEAYADYERGQAAVDLSYILNIIDQSLAVVIILMSLYYFEVLRKLSRFSAVFVIITYFVINVLASGKMKYLGDVVIFTFFAIMVKLAAKRARFKASRFFIVGLITFFVTLLFLEILRQRYEAINIDLSNIIEKVHPLILWNDSSPLLSLFSNYYLLALSVFLGYFSNGLYGLYLSLTLPFEWTYFIGNSYSLGRIVEIAISDKGAVLKSTYPYRVAVTYGWDFDKWHSLFAWLASDITFPGILFITPLFSFLYARLWLQAIKASNPFSGPLFIYLSLGLIFCYANNQIMHTLSGVIVLLILLAGWMFSKNFRPSVIGGCGKIKSNDDVE